MERINIPEVKDNQNITQDMAKAAIYNNITDNREISKEFNIGVLKGLKEELKHFSQADGVEHGRAR